MAAVEFHGTEQESDDIRAAVAHNCGCEFAPDGMQMVRRCDAHAMLLDDQRALNGLMFVKTVLLERLKREEWAPRAPDKTAPA